jgi:hypothetical protein
LVITINVIYSGYSSILGSILSPTPSCIWSGLKVVEFHMYYNYGPVVVECDSSDCASFVVANSPM